MPESLPSRNGAAYAAAQRAYYEQIANAARRLAHSASICALDSAASGGHSVYSDMNAMRAALDAQRPRP